MARTIEQAGLANSINLIAWWKMNTVTEDSTTKLLLHFDGADTATTVFDGTGKQVTSVGTAQLDTAQSNFGRSSLLLDGNSDYLTLADSADWAFGTGDFTIDCWARWASVATSTICGQRVDANNEWWFYWNPNALAFYQIAGGSTNISFNNAFIPVQDTWYHIAITRSGNTWRMFVNGTQIGADYTDADSHADIASVLYIGVQKTATYANYFNGWLDEFRIVKGTAKWTTAFTPPTTEYRYALFEEQVNGYHLTAGASTPTAVAGILGGAGSFVASSTQYASIADASCPNLEIAGDKTTSVWYNPTTLGDGAGSSSWVTCKSDASKTELYGIVIDPNTGATHYYNKNAEGVTGPVIVAGAWHHLVGVSDVTNNKRRIYVDGVKVEDTGCTSTADTNGAFALGRAGAKSDQYANGVIDDCAVFNRALTDEEVLKIYGGSGSFIPFLL